MSIAGAEKRGRLDSGAIAIAVVTLLTLVAHTPCAALCGDDVSPQFVLNTLTLGSEGSDRVTVTVEDAFNNRPVGGAYARILTVPGGEDTVAQGPVAHGGTFWADVPPGTYFAEITHGGYRTGYSDAFDCLGTGESIAVPVELRTRTVVLVHGWAAAGGGAIWSDQEAADWKGILEAEPLNYRVETPDMPGSHGIPGTQSIAAQADFLAEEIESYGVESVYIVAHSMGGLVSRWYNERLAHNRVVRLITLATPHHGSGLVTSFAGIAKVLIWGTYSDLFAPEEWWLLHPIEFVRKFHERYEGVIDLIPNSPRLQLLNQRAVGWNDWWGSCLWEPVDEILTFDEAEYCTVTATDISWIPLHWSQVGAVLLAQIPSLCFTTDGVVPYYSAPLWADGDSLEDSRVRNYLASTIGENSHHLGRLGPVGIVANLAVQEFVIHLLSAVDLPSGHWVPGQDHPGPPCGPDREEGFVALPMIDGEIEGEAALVETFTVEPTDSLRVIFTWFADDIFLDLRDPLGAFVDTSTAFIDRDSKIIIYTVGSPEPGSWELHVESQPGTPVQRYVAIPSMMSDTVLGLDVDPSTARPGQNLIVRASVASAGSGIPGAAVTATLLAPSGVEDELILYDDGMHGDGAADDGVYGAAYVAAEEGPYVATADMTLSPGRDQARDAISRQAWFTFAAVESLDLAIVDGSTQVLETTQFVDMPCHILTEVTNSGSSACDSVRVVFDLEGAANPLPDMLLALAPGQTELLEVPLTPAAACTHVIHVRVRAADGRADENTSNDVATVTFLPEIGVPNLTIDAVTLSNPNPAPGEEITAEIVISSNNTARSTGTFVDVYYDLAMPPVVGQRGDEEIYIQPLMPGESFTLTSQPFSYAADDYFDLYFQVDPEDRCSESDETDNIHDMRVVTSVDDQESDLVAFEDSGHVRLQWVIPTLDGITGFNVYRSLSSNGPFARVNESAIAPCSPCEYEDVTSWPGSDFWYKLHGLVAGGGEELLAGPIWMRTEGVLSFGLAIGRPNPSSRETWFALDLPSDCADARLEIHDVSGRLVRVVTEGHATRGRHSIRWDLTDSSGRPVAAGVYFARASAGEWTGTRKVVVVR